MRATSIHAKAPMNRYRATARIELHLRVSEGVGDAQRSSHQSRYPDKTRLISVVGQSDHRCVCKKHRGAHENRAPPKRAPAFPSEPRLTSPEPPVEPVSRNRHAGAQQGGQRQWQRVGGHWRQGEEAVQVHPRVQTVEQVEVRHHQQANEEQLHLVLRRPAYRPRTPGGLQPGLHQRSWALARFLYLLTGTRVEMRETRLDGPREPENRGGVFARPRR